MGRVTDAQPRRSPLLNNTWIFFVQKIGVPSLIAIESDATNAFRQQLHFRSKRGFLVKQRIKGESYEI